MSTIIYGLYVKGKLIYYSPNKKDVLRYTGKHHISGYIGPLSEQEIKEYGIEPRSSSESHS